MRIPIPIKCVPNIAPVNTEFGITLFSTFFVNLTIASIDPFIHSKAGGSFNLICFDAISL